MLLHRLTLVCAIMAIAASLHGRKWAGCELNEDYVKIMQQRLNKEFEVLK